MPRHTGRCGHRPLRTAYRNPMRHIRAGRAVRPYEGSAAHCSFPVIPSQSADWRGNPFSAPAGAVLPPYAPSDAPRERPLPLPLGEVAERSEDGEGKQKRTASGRFFSLSINLSCHSEGAARPWESVIF